MPGLGGGREETKSQGKEKERRNKEPRKREGYHLGKNLSFHVVVRHVFPTTYLREVALFHLASCLLASLLPCLLPCLLVSVASSRADGKGVDGAREDQEGNGGCGGGRESRKASCDISVRRGESRQDHARKAPRQRKPPTFESAFAAFAFVISLVDCAIRYYFFVLLFVQCSLPIRAKI